MINSDPLNFILFDSKTNDPSSNEKLSLENEIQRYSNTETTEVEDIYDYWFSKRESYVILSNLALMLLASSGTSVPSERLFSKSGYQLWDRRNRLSPSRIEMIIFIQENYELLKKYIF